MKWAWALPLAALAAVIGLGREGASGSAVALAVTAFVLLCLLCNPFRLFDFLPRRFRICFSAAAILDAVALSKGLTVAARVGLFLSSAGILFLAVRRFADWKQQEWVLQSSDVDRILSDIGHQVSSKAFDNWVSHGRAEARALLHQVARVEITEAKLEASHMPIYCLGYLHGARRVKKLEQQLEDEKQDRSELAQKYFDVLDQMRVRDNGETDATELIKKLEKANDLLRSRSEKLEKQLESMRRVHREDLKEIERLEGLVDDDPVQCENLQERNILMMRAYDNGASYTQLAEQYNLSKSGVRFAIKEARKNNADAS